MSERISCPSSSDEGSFRHQMRLGETREGGRRSKRKFMGKFMAKLFSGIRASGYYNLPRNCDNTELLKAICSEAGWCIEADGTPSRQISFDSSDGPIVAI